MIHDLYDYSNRVNGAVKELTNKIFRYIVKKLYNLTHSKGIIAMIYIIEIIFDDGSSCVIGHTLADSMQEVSQRLKIGSPSAPEELATINFYADLPEGMPEDVVGVHLTLSQEINTLTDFLRINADLYGS